MRMARAAGCISSPACWASGGIAAPTKAPSRVGKMANTSVVAAHRGTLCLTNQEAAGSRPSARKNATPLCTRIEDMDSRTRTAP